MLQYKSQKVAVLLVQQDEKQHNATMDATVEEDKEKGGQVKYPPQKQIQPIQQKIA